jgi:hypothetical protein
VWMGATLDGIVEATGAVFEAKFASHGRSPKRPPQKNIWHSCSATCRWRTQSPLFYSIITGGGNGSSSLFTPSSSMISRPAHSPWSYRRQTRTPPTNPRAARSLAFERSALTQSEVVIFPKRR